MDRHALLAWYDANKRGLPWRRDTDPYRVLVSEAMLQQTRVETVLPYYEAWMARWPTAEALAAAKDEEVHAAWSGLGYYRRARNLHAAAKAIVSHGWPEQLGDLPGVGPYTAAAVGSIAFGQPVAVVDGNVIRVMSRLRDIELDVGTAAGRRAVQEAADAGLHLERPGDWNQAVMELGATICKPRPDCTGCPVASDCLAQQRGTTLERPVKQPKRPAKEEAIRFAYAERDGCVLLAKRPEKGLLAGTWGLPETEADAPVLGTATHKFTHRTWRMTIVAHEANEGCWIPLDGLDEIGLSTAARRAIEAAQRRT
ncbi:MAG: A/G-specific adenine glycosylase [Thermoplasmatota archaeon]